jgi:hypothetical protein
MAEFERAFQMQGFDQYQPTRWQMIPNGGTRYMLLRDGAGLTVTSANPGVATVTEVTLAQIPTANRATIRAQDRIFKIDGKSWNITTIDAKSGATLAAQLEVDIKNKKTVNIGFNFVRDNAGHRTRRVAASVTHWVAGLNYIYLGQCNIEMKAKSTRTVTAAQDLGQVVRFSSHLPGVPASQHEWSVVTALGDSAADMNIFFVWEYEQDNSPFSDNTDAGTLSNNCIFEDNAGRQIAETLAHEIGHYLGCDDHYIAGRKRELMYGITDVRGIHIPKQDANTMNL